MVLNKSKAERRRTVTELELITRERIKRSGIGDPTTFGWPDLLREQRDSEDTEDYEAWRRAELRRFIEEDLYFIKDGKRIEVRLIEGSKVCPKSMMDLIYDCFYQKTDQAILWKPRGSGGSLSVSITIFLCMVYRKKSFTLVAGSENQAKIVYNYVMQLWQCNPALASAMLARNPTSTKIETRKEVGGVTLSCVTASDRAVRGIHTAGLVIDECSQRDATIDRVLEAALQGPMSEDDPLIIMCSTFHNAAGFYQEGWDFAEEKGYTRYRWDIYECQKACKKKIDCRKCYLTNVITKYDKKGEPVGVRYTGCAGRGRTTSGWQTYEQLVNTKKQNTGSTVWTVEFECVITGEPIVTYDGIFPIEQIQVGNFVKTSDGTYRPVLRVMNRSYSGEIIKIRTHYNGNDVCLTPEHPVLVQSKDGSSEPIWLPAKDVKKGDYLTNPRPVKPKDVLPELVYKKRVGKTGNQYSGVRVLTENKSIPITEETLWVLGLLVGDGHASERSICLSWNKAQPKIRERYDKWVKSLGYVLQENVQRSDKILNLRFHNTGLSEWFMANFYNEKKEKTVPPWIYDLPEALIRAFLKGWEDADGCIDSPKGRDRMRVSTAYDHCAKTLQYLYSLCGINSSVIKCKQGGYSNREYQYHVAYPIPEREWSDLVRVIDVQKEYYEGKVHNLEVAEKQTYCTPVFAVHNCNRPESGRTVYPTEKIVQAQKACPKNLNGDPYVPYNRRYCDLSIGVDWGITQTAVILLTKTPEYIGVLEARFFEGQPLSDITRYFHLIHQKYRPGSLLTPAEKAKRKAERRQKTKGAVSIVSSDDEGGDTDPITIYGDSSHPFNNIELGQLGYIVMPVQFNQFKDLGIENLVKYFHSGRIMLPKKYELLCRQLMLYARDPKGKPIKKDDHGPDALLSYLDGKTQVMTPNGWARINSLGVGSLVLTHKGRYRPITIWNPQPYKKEHEVVVEFHSKGGKHIVTLEHPFQMEDGTWKEAEQLQVGDRVKCLAAHCAYCGERVAWYRKYCDSCVGEQRNRRWKNPGEKEELERQQKREQLLEEYESGRRDQVLRIAGNHTNSYEFTAIEVVSVEIRPLTKPKIAYHFEVEEDHSYIGKGIVSHNCAALAFPYLEYYGETDMASGTIPMEKGSGVDVVTI